VVRGEEGARIGEDPEVTFVKTAFDHKGFIIVTKASEKLAAYPKPSGAVTRTFFDAGKGAEKSACDLYRYGWVFRHGNRKVSKRRAWPAHIALPRGCSPVWHARRLRSRGREREGVEGWSSRWRPNESELSRGRPAGRHANSIVPFRPRRRQSPHGRAAAERPAPIPG